MPANVTITATTLPASLFEGTLQQVLTLYAAHLQGTFVGNVLTGQTGGSAPTSDVGIWVNSNGLLYKWNTTELKYLPIPMAIGRIYTGGVINLTKFLSTATADRTLYAPDKSGTLALTSDVYGKINTLTLGGASPSINLNDEAKHYYLTLSANASLSFTNLQDGQERHIWVENPDTATFTFAISGALWPGASAPTQTVGGGGYRAIDHYKVWIVGSTIFAERTANYQIAAAGGGSDTTPPTVSSITRTSSGVINITFNELLQGATLTPADFTVLKNAVSKTVTAAVATGTGVRLTVTGNSNISTDTVTVQYAGTNIKDSAGNAAAVFGPSAATYASTTGGSGGGGGGTGGQNEIP